MHIADTINWVLDNFNEFVKENKATKLTSGVSISHTVQRIYSIKKRNRSFYLFIFIVDILNILLLVSVPIEKGFKLERDVRSNESYASVPGDVR